MRPLRTLAALTLLLGTGACAATYDATHLGVPISLADVTGGPANGTPFSVTKHPVYVMWGLMSASEPNLDDLLSGQLGPGAGLAQVRIHSRMRLTDLFVTVISAGFLSPRSVTFEGVIVAPGAAPSATH
ncbi:MAG TPA: hypothetical protein VEV39_02875 [Gemmatimonadales bacterium]|nr:hypothetical protein [Gemmatimonadales bacterium]